MYSKNQTESSKADMSFSATSALEWGVNASVEGRYKLIGANASGGYKNTSARVERKGPKSRFTGSGGANDIASLADKVVAMMVHEKRRFPERVQYLTSPAGMRGPSGEDRYDCGLYA